MRRITLILATILALAAASATGSTIEIKVPDATAVGAPVVIPIAGTTAETLAYIKLVYWPKEGVACSIVRPVPHNLADAPLPPEIRFHATRPGRYGLTVVTTDTEGVQEWAEAVLVVGGDAPDPFPLPPGERMLVVIHETKNRPPAEATMLGELRAYLRESKTDCQYFDQDAIAGRTDETPKHLVKAIEEAVKAGLPAMVLTARSTDGRYSVVAVETLDKSAAAIELVKKWGGK